MAGREYETVAENMPSYVGHVDFIVAARMCVPPFPVMVNMGIRIGGPQGQPMPVSVPLKNAEQMLEDLAEAIRVAKLLPGPEAN